MPHASSSSSYIIIVDSLHHFCQIVFVFALLVFCPVFVLTAKGTGAFTWDNKMIDMVGVVIQIFTDPLRERMPERKTVRLIENLIGEQKRTQREVSFLRNENFRLSRDCSSFSRKLIDDERGSEGERRSVLWSILLLFCLFCSVCSAHRQAGTAYSLASEGSWIDLIMKETFVSLEMSCFHLTFLPPFPSACKSSDSEVVVVTESFSGCGFYSLPSGAIEFEHCLAHLFSWRSLSGFDLTLNSSVHSPFVLHLSPAFFGLCWPLSICFVQFSNSLFAVRPLDSSFLYQNTTWRNKLSWAWEEGALQIWSSFPWCPWDLPVSNPSLCSPSLPHSPLSSFCRLSLPCWLPFFVAFKAMTRESEQS